MIYIAIWLVLAILTYGMSLAYWQREFAILAKGCIKEDIIFSILWGLFAPFTTIVIFCNGGYKHGLKFK